MLDNLELVLLTIDEVVDSGHIMELDQNSVASRVLMKAPDSMPQVSTFLRVLCMNVLMVHGV